MPGMPWHLARCRTLAENRDVGPSGFVGPIPGEFAAPDID
jgi:hypothetical protein